MSYGDAKVYYDGSHYIAIPKELQYCRRNTRKAVLNEKETAKERNALFERLYKENENKKHHEKKTEIINGLKPFIENEKIEEFVEKELEKKRRNKAERRKRLYRKVYLQNWQYFCTFTYDDNKLTEHQFRIKLSNTLKHFSNRKGWKYIGVWERSPENNRLHFHALVSTNKSVGNFEIIKDYSTKNHKMQTAYQNTYFFERFGRNDFKPINAKELSKAIKYLTKYIEKSGERIVYSKNTPAYFISDILDNDIVCTIGNEDRKLLLYDDFNCWNEGCLIGKVSSEVIEQMPKSN